MLWHKYTTSDRRWFVVIGIVVIFQWFRHAAMIAQSWWCKKNENLVHELQIEQDMFLPHHLLFRMDKGAKTSPGPASITNSGCMCGCGCDCGSGCRSGLKGHI